MIGNDLLRYNIKDKKFVVFDFEGDLNTFFGTPFQLGFSVYHGADLVENYDFYIKWPNLQISDFVKKYAHYDPKRMEKEGKDPTDVFLTLSKFLLDKSYNVVGANIFGFDCLLAYNCLKRLGLPYSWEFMERSYDVNALFKAYKLGIKPPESGSILAYQLSMTTFRQKGLKSSVSYVAKEFKIPFDEEKMHSAGYDCQIIFSNFLELIKKFDIK